MNLELDSQIGQAIAERVFYGCVLLVQKGDEVLHHKAYGQTNHTDPTQAVTCDTIFDLASLTKILVTTPLALVASQQAKFSPTDRVVTYLPEFNRLEQAKIRIVHLLQHTSGLVAHRAYYEKGLSLGIRPATQEALEWTREQILQEEPSCQPGLRVCYSDVGFMLLDFVLQTLFGKSIDVGFAEQILRPLGLGDLFFVDLKRCLEKSSQPDKWTFAATERCVWRKQTLRGVVHDDNAFFMGGVSGHAGLFGTARDVAGLMTTWLQAYQGKPSLFETDWVRLFWQPAEAAGPMRTMGFDQPARSGSQAGSKISLNTVGHLGFTGVSVWLDLDRDLLIVLLTNRVCPSRNNRAINEFRPRLHDTIVAMFD